ncbi:MAG: hypothetical protein HC884_19820 [Chloroflexaceae bacterium]|nr:hypothetical protein [Chloroflexaceae bacterium]
MQTMTFQVHVGADGILKLEVPIGMAEVELDVVVTFHPRRNGPAAPNNLLQFIGAIDDPTFVRGPQGEYELLP